MNEESTGLRGWIDARFPMTKVWKEHAAEYLVPKNFNFWYLFGVFSIVVLVNQIVTGIWLTMYYTPTNAAAFNSVEYIMRDVRLGWLLRYMHSTGASAFFIVIYFHMYRAIMYGSFKQPRELVWVLGVVIFVLLLLESGSGYVLPWGQMSYWATKVLTQIYTVIPWIGESIARWVQGDYSVSGVTLHRFYALHVTAFPLLIIFVVFLHVVALHRVGSNNPDGIDKKKENKIPFHPYYTVKDLLGVVGFLIVFFAVVFFEPTMFGYFLEPTNFSPANPLVTPPHIAPPWYLAPYYAILRAIPNKLFGVFCSAAAVALLFILPWLDRSRVRSIRYRGLWTKLGLAVFVISFIFLGALGTMVLSPTNVWLSRLFTVLYFLYFITMPIYTRFEKTKPIPEKVMQS